MVDKDAQWKKKVFFPVLLKESETWRGEMIYQKPHNEGLLTTVPEVFLLLYYVWPCKGHKWT